MLQILPSLEEALLQKHFNLNFPIPGTISPLYPPPYQFFGTLISSHSKGSLSKKETESGDAVDCNNAVDAADDNNVSDADGATESDAVGADVDAYFEGCNLDDGAGIDGMLCALPNNFLLPNKCIFIQQYKASD